MSTLLGNVTREMEVFFLKKDQIESLEIKRRISECKNSVDGLHRRLEKNRKVSVNLKLDQ